MSHVNMIIIMNVPTWNFQAVSEGCSVKCSGFIDHKPVITAVNTSAVRQQVIPAVVFSFETTSAVVRFNIFSANFQTNLNEPCMKSKASIFIHRIYYIYLRMFRYIQQYTTVCVQLFVCMKTQLSWTWMYRCTVLMTCCSQTVLQQLITYL